MIKREAVVFVMFITILSNFFFCGEEKLTGLAVYLPSKKDIKEWKMTEKPRFFQADNLWEYINGGADAYLAYGFQEVVTVTYENKNKNLDAIIDIYQMKDPLNTFGIYSSERSPNYNYIKIGVEGYIAGSSLNFWKGSYYIKIVSHSESKDIQDEMKKLAKIIDSKITETGGEPEEIKMFPEEGLNKKSVRYISQNVLGQSYFQNGFTADYKINGKEMKIFLIFLANEDEAKNGFKNYKSFIGKSGKLLSRDTRRLKRRKGLGNEVFAGVDSFYGKLISFRNGAVIGGVLGIDKLQTGEKLVREIVSKGK